jgi:hypothetical protein
MDTTHFDIKVQIIVMSFLYSHANEKDDTLKSRIF